MKRGKSTRKGVRAGQLGWLALFAAGVLAGVGLGITTGVPVSQGSVAAPTDVDGIRRSAASLVARRSRETEIPAVPNGLMPPRPRIAIVIDDMGLSWDAFDAANDLPSPVTLSFLPYGKDTQKMIEALAPGHDAMLHLPMEPVDHREDAGPNMLTVDETREEIRETLSLNLGLVQGYSGVNNHTGSLFTSNREGMEVVLKELDRRGLFFLDSITTARPVAHRIAQAEGYRVLERNVFLDHNYPDVSVSSVKSQLAALEEVAKADGYAVAIGHPYRATLVALETWLATAESRGFDLVLVKDLTTTRPPTTLVRLR